MKFVVMGYVINIVFLFFVWMFDGIDKLKGVMVKNINMGVVYIYKDIMVRNSYVVYFGIKGFFDIFLYLWIDMFD